ncbi:hypothetical protein SAY86_026797 [Trapa natans]|uniref:Programmed cell death protein 2 C-terminal domain-containing protein n=1 Tax=Trapa natans TaxID=22666 RepID=A0AAN7QEX2_TRANT|nr:hypothetical protein SAY86_026797 [Trapa natans]
MGEVILGMPGPWAKKFHEASDHYTTKIGGLPDWPFPQEALDSNLLKCRTCGSKLSLVTQVYAPIKSGALMLEERVLYILGCLTLACGKTTLSWRALRIQKPCIEEDESNAAHGSAVPNSEPSEPAKETSWWEGFDEEDNEDMDLLELGRALSEAATSASNHKKKSGNQNSCTVGNPSSLKLTLPDYDSNVTVIPCFYIYSVEEASKDVTSVSMNYSSLSIKESRTSTDDNAEKEERWDEEQYEYDRALTADRTYLKFKKRLDANPEQCFRYSYGGRALLAEKVELENPGTCELCSCQRHFEMQLMPPLLYFLQEKAKGPLKETLENWSWITLMIYTCSQSCLGSHNTKNRTKGWIVAEESVLVQSE